MVGLILNLPNKRRNSMVDTWLKLPEDLESYLRAQEDVGRKVVVYENTQHAAIYVPAAKMPEIEKIVIPFPESNGFTRKIFPLDRPWEAYECDVGFHLETIDFSKAITPKNI